MTVQSHEGTGECVRVVLRCRPLSTREITDNRKNVVSADEAHKTVSLQPARPGDPSREFTFDAVFGQDASQAQVFDDTARGIIDSVLEGYNGTIFAYGQTGAGKTYTMEGDGCEGVSGGIIPASCAALFSAISHSTAKQFLVRVSFLELYNEDIRDLLSKSPSSALALRDAGKERYIKGLSAFTVSSAAEILRILQVGRKNRQTATTAMNKDSSRSHSVFTITIESSGSDQEAVIPAGSQAMYTVGKLNLVDLAGSERVAKSGATGDRLKEASKINLSLSALGNVISALADGKSGHIPYRSSQLTRLLQDSLGGNSRTVMVVNIGPADYNYEETLGTLRFAGRARSVRNRPVINEDPRDAMLRQYQLEIAGLRAELALPRGGNQSGTAAWRCCHVDLTTLGEPVALDSSADLAAQMKSSHSQHEAEVGRLTLESQSRQEALAHLEAACGQQTAAMQLLQQQRDEEHARREELSARLENLQGKLVSGGASAKAAVRSSHRSNDSIRKSANTAKAALQAHNELQTAATAEISDLQLQAGEAVTETQGVWRKHEALRRELIEAQSTWSAEKEALKLQVRTLEQRLQQQIQLSKRPRSGGARSGMGEPFIPRPLPDVAVGPEAAVVLAAPPWELPTAYSLASWQDANFDENSSVSRTSSNSSIVSLDRVPWQQQAGSFDNRGVTSSSSSKSRLSRPLNPNHPT